MVDGRSARRAGFTLVELIVSVGVLALMTTMAGAVFHLTLKSTGEAKALTSVTQRIRAFERTLRNDLAGVQPETSLLVIVPARMNAYWTAEGRDGDDDGNPSNGYPHPEDLERETHDHATGEHVLAEPRADRLMFVTARQGSSFVDPSLGGGLQAVTYAHAILGEWQDEDAAIDMHDWQWRAQYGEKEAQDQRRARFENAMLLAENKWEPQTGFGRLFPTPAQDWHLARRSVLMVEYDKSDPPPPFDEDDSDGYSPAVAFALDDCHKQLGESDAYDCDVSGDIPGLDGERFRLALVEGRQDVVAYPADSLQAGQFHFLEDMVFNLVHDPDYEDGQFKVEDRAQWYARSELDLTPPALIADRLGAHFLHRCASFKVEFALNLPELRGLGEVLWIDPADLVAGVSGVDDWNDDDLEEHDWSPTRARIEHMMLMIRPSDDETGVLGEEDIEDPTTPATRAYQRLETLRDVDLYAGDPDNIVQVAPDPATGDPMARWYTAAPDGTSPDPLYPTALRITIDVYDDEQRLDRPMRHVMIFEIGG